MKKLIAIIMMIMPLAAVAQYNDWEKDVPARPDTYYLAGAVPEVDGQVVFQTTIKAEGKNKEQILAIVKSELDRMSKEDNQIKKDIPVSYQDSQKQITANFQEWLIFKKKPLELDRTRLIYNLSAQCNDGEAILTIANISYIYEEERNPVVLEAETWISDRYALNKKKDKLLRFSNKFRRKTIDRKDYLFDRFTKLLQDK